MNIKNLILKPTSTIKEALGKIGQEGRRIAIVLDEEDKFLGVLADPDIRRGIMSGLDLQSSIKTIVRKNPVIAYETSTKEHIVNLALKHDIYEIPILDKEENVIDIQTVSKLLFPKAKLNRVVLMVGGLGTRLRPLTKSIPKPMLKVGSKPILQIILERFVKQGFTNFTFCLGYKSDIIKDFFGNGEKFGAVIDYVKEEKRLGTAGALGLLHDLPNEPFFVMNGDILTEINFDDMLKEHEKKGAKATMCVREYEHQIPYGVVQEENGFVTSIEEKPKQSFFVSAGIYILNAECLQNVPKNEYLDMPNLFTRFIDDNQKVARFKVDDYWIDIGRHEEYKRANEDYEGF